MNFKRLTTAVLCTILATGGVTPVLAEDSVGSTANTFSDQGNIKLTYSAAHWDESGADKTATSDNTHHAVGTYQVTIPTAITYTGMNVGNVSTNDDYTVNVRGAINDGEKVTLTAETGKTVVNNGTISQITETTTQGKTEWFVDDCYGSENADGSINGTDCTDNIKMSGTAKATGYYTGNVAYTASLSKTEGTDTPEAPGDPKEPTTPDVSGNAKYAVSVYAIDQDMNKEDGSQYTHTMTFGPATGGNYVKTAKPAHIALADETDTDKCIHNHTWSEITALAKSNPKVFAKCITNNCTKTVDLQLNSTLMSTGWTDAQYQAETGDGPSTLRYELKDEMKVWQPGTGSGTYQYGDNTDGYPASRIRAMLNGADNNTDVERANKTYIYSRPDETVLGYSDAKYGNVQITDISTITANNSLLSCFPDTLKSSIVPKAVKSDTVYNNTTGNSKTTYDKLWLFSNAEVGGTSRPNEGTAYSRMNSDSARVVYDSTGSVSWWFLRSANTYYVNSACSVGYNGGLGNVYYASSGNGGSAPGFVVGA